MEIRTAGTSVKSLKPDPKAVARCCCIVEQKERATQVPQRSSCAGFSHTWCPGFVCHPHVCSVGDGRKRSLLYVVLRSTSTIRTRPRMRPRVPTIRSRCSTSPRAYDSMAWFS